MVFLLIITGSSIFFFLIIILIIITIATKHKHRTDSEIIGIWKDDNSKIALYKDGTYISWGKKGEINNQGKYEIFKNYYIHINYKGLIDNYDAEMFKYAVINKKLVFRKNGVQVKIYHKV